MENPADMPSRGLSPIELTHSELWAKGPRWLGILAAEETPQGMTMPEDCAVGLRMADRTAMVGLLITEVSIGIDCREYSSIERLLRVTGRVLLFVHKLKSRCSETADISEVNILTQAETLWITIAQKQFPQDSNLQKQFDHSRSYNLTK